ncbi:MAG: PqqD family protein [Gemmatimonadetes bacterium]|nr:PqqD family protein [Gemmatimonadota bacterium]
MQVEPEMRVARNDDIIFTALDDTVVMMDVDKGRYYELDPTAASVWALLERESLVASLCDALLERYDVSAETCRRDVQAFLGELADLGVVQIRA